MSAQKDSLAMSTVCNMAWAAVSTQDSASRMKSQLLATQLLQHWLPGAHLPFSRVLHTHSANSLLGKQKLGHLVYP